MHNSFEPFPSRLRRLRHNEGYTNALLGEKAGVPYSLVAALQTGAKGVGENNARKIGKALELKGDEFTNFVFDAIDTCTERVLEEYRDYPSRVLNLVAMALKLSGITPKMIKGAEIVRNSNTAPALALHLNNGHSAFVKVEITYKQ